jgi:hypothetical protein
MFWYNVYSVFISFVHSKLLQFEVAQELYVHPVYQEHDIASEVLP